jgi:hypothetical protein
MLTLMVAGFEPLLKRAISPPPGTPVSQLPGSFQLLFPAPVHVRVAARAGRAK